MTHNHGGHGFGLALLVAAIAFAFGPRAARIVVGGVLVVAGVFFTYVMFRIVAGTI